MSRANARRYWMNTNYLAAILLATLGWIWLIVWVVRKIF
jgi:hypothetical protein